MADEEKFQNVLENAAQPIDVRKLSQVFGVAEYVAAEVLVSYLARAVFKIEKRSVMELTAIHAVSVPFLGGLGMWFDDNSPYDYAAPVGDQVADGAKGIPAVYASQYICNTALQGLHAPKLNFKDILVTAAAKVVTRPLLSFIYPYLTEAMQDNLQVVEALIRQQRAVAKTPAK